MITSSSFRHRAECALIGASLALGNISCGSNVERVPVTAFTEGVETDMQEVAPNEWRIAEERVLEDSLDTRVIARGLDGVVDTFALAELETELAFAEAGSDTTSQRRYRRRSMFGPVLMYGLIGNRLGGYRVGAGPTAAAYTSPSAFARTQRAAGSRLNATGRTTTVARPSGGRSGYGSRSRSSGGRSYGG